GDSLEIAFSSVGQGLKSADGKRVVHFEIAGEDGVFYPADAEVEHHLVRLSQEKVPQPIDARYAWHPFPEPPVNLVNSAGYPASPFTTQSKF
ncbi:MAG: sialate O-acetylesterase, partial [Planctomycetaceae bacterium]|nr:sialate O-acetylesterase [Planctomycetaceae bacterium]